VVVSFGILLADMNIVLWKCFRTTLPHADTHLLPAGERTDRTHSNVATQPKRAQERSHCAPGLPGVASSCMLKYAHAETPTTVCCESASTVCYPTSDPMSVNLPAPFPPTAACTLGCMVSVASSSTLVAMLGTRSRHSLLWLRRLSRCVGLLLVSQQQALTHTL
jgi:hypothetical protein